MSDSFHAGGAKEYLEALDAEMKERLAQLKSKLRLESDSIVRERLKDEIAAVRREFKEKTAAADRSIY